MDDLGILQAISTLDSSPYPCRVAPELTVCSTSLPHINGELTLQRCSGVHVGKTPQRVNIHGVLLHLCPALVWELLLQRHVVHLEAGLHLHCSAQLCSRGRSTGVLSFPAVRRSALSARVHESCTFICVPRPKDTSLPTHRNTPRQRYSTHTPQTKEEFCQRPGKTMVKKSFPIHTFGGADGAAESLHV